MKQPTKVQVFDPIRYDRDNANIQIYLLEMQVAYLEAELEIMTKKHMELVHRLSNG